MRKAPETTTGMDVMSLCNSRAKWAAVGGGDGYGGGGTTGRPSRPSSGCASSLRPRASAHRATGCRGCRCSSTPRSPRTAACSRSCWPTRRWRPCEAGRPLLLISYCSRRTVLCNGTQAQAIGTRPIFVQVTDVCSMFASAALPQWQERHRLVARWLAPCFFLQV